MADSRTTLARGRLPGLTGRWCGLGVFDCVGACFHFCPPPVLFTDGLETGVGWERVGLTYRM